MEHIVDFVIRHWGLTALLAVNGGLLAYAFGVEEKGSLDPQGATVLINQKDALMLDIRTTGDFAKGHIIGAMNLPANGLGQQLGILEKHKQRPIIVSCRSGAQSSHACQTLRKAGFPQVYNLRGGILAWQNANLPLTRKFK
ncbi:MAG: rhodanese-like domain-containing protein [Pseudomonadota bacterium]